MTRIGYTRVSTVDQHLDLQRNALRLAGCNRIFEDHGVGEQRTTWWLVFDAEGASTRRYSGCMET